MKKFLVILLIALTRCAFGQSYSATITIPGLALTNAISVITIGTPKKVSDYPHRSTPNGTDLILLADPVSHTNANTSFSDIQLNLQATITPPLTYMTWGGPSNFVTMGPTNFYWYVTFTPCAVNGFVYDNANVNFAMLSILNNSGSNITFTSYADGPQEDATHTYTVTNGFVVKSWMEFSHGFTNHVTRVFKH